MSSSSCYRLLKVKEGATLTDIKAAFRKQALIMHPDKSKAPNAQERFQALTRAYEDATAQAESGAARQRRWQQRNREGAAKYGQYDHRTYYYQGKEYRAQGSAWQDMAWMEWILHPGRYITSSTRLKISQGCLMFLLSLGVYENAVVPSLEGASTPAAAAAATAGGGGGGGGGSNGSAQHSQKRQQ